MSRCKCEAEGLVAGSEVIYILKTSNMGNRFRDKFTLLVSVEGLILCSVTTTCHAEGGRGSEAWPGCLLGVRHVRV